MPFVLGKPELIEKNLEVVDLSKSWSGGQKNQILQYWRAKKTLIGKKICESWNQDQRQKIDIVRSS